MAEITKYLARDHVFEVNNGTSGSPDWLEVKGINTWSSTTTKNDADTTTFDEDGRMSHLPASRGNGFGLQGFALEDPDDGSKDPGQAACEAWAAKIGTAGIQQFRITTPGGYVLTFDASADVKIGGGGKDDPTGWTCDMVVTGAIVTSDDLALPGAPTSPSGTALTGGILASWTAGTGDDITAYEVVVYLTGTEVARVRSSAKPIAVTGLATSAHTFKVRAYNATGWGPLSVASSNVTPT